MNKNSVLKIVSSNQNPTRVAEDKQLIEIEKHMKLSASTKKIFSSLVARISEKMDLEEFHTEALAMIAAEIETWVWANREIQLKNKEAPGTGYIQTYRTKARNISTEIVLRNQALKNFAMMSKKFGLSVRDLNEIDTNENPNQLSMFIENLQNVQ